MKIGARVAAGGLLPPWLAAASGDGTRGGRTRPTLALVDAALGESRTYAALAARSGAHIVDIQGDIGALWHATLRRAGATLVGALRGSDFFVLRHLAAGEGRVVSHESDGRTVTFRIDHAGAGADAHTDAPGNG
jgi:hypothetical protein